MEELKIAVKGLLSKVTSSEKEVGAVKVTQGTFDDNFASMEKNTVFVDEQLQDLETETNKNKVDLNDICRKLLYLEAYSR